MKEHVEVATTIAQALGWSEPGYHGVVPAIYPSGPYLRNNAGQYMGGSSYGRDQNPGYHQPQALLAALEKGSSALLFSSGMAAACAVFNSLPGESLVVVPEYMYFTIQMWLQRQHQQKRLHLQIIPNNNHDCLVQALKKASVEKLVWLESPANPMGYITDIARQAEIAREFGAWVVVDNTLSTPIVTQPLDLGAHVVMHSASKQLNGHADVVAGGLVTSSDHNLWQRVQDQRAYGGAILGSFEAWLLLRGMRTLSLRVAKSHSSAHRLAHFLREHPQVSRVFYPGFDDWPNHEVACAQMQGGFGFVVSFIPKGGIGGVKHICRELCLFRNASSLGGLESLYEWRAQVEGGGSRVPANLIRLSIGLEHPDDLEADLKAALDGLKKEASLDS